MQKIWNFISNKKMLIITIVLICLLSLVMQLGDPDIYWHIKNGEWIINNGLPTKDQFSYWDTGFISQEWLFDVLSHFVYNIFGYHGIVIIPTIFFGIALYLCATSQKTNNYFPILLMLIMFFANPIMTIMRPHCASFLLFGIVMFILNKNKALWVIPILSLICVNMHGGVATIILVIYLLHQIAYIYDNYKNYDKKTIVYRLLIFVLIVLSLLCNPYGVKILIYGFKMPPISTECLPIIDSSKDLLILFIVILPAACMAFVKERKLIDILMMFMGIMACLIWVRMIGLYVLIFAAHGMQYVAKTIETIYNKFFSDIKIMLKIKTILSMAFTCLSIFLFCITVCSAVIVPENKFESYPKITAKPVIEYIEENNIDVKNNIMFNHYNLGGYLIFHEIPVFVDGRCEPYLEEYGNKPIMDDYFHMIDFGQNTIQLLKEYNVKYITAYNNSKIVEKLQEINAVETLVDENGVVLLEITNLGGAQ